MTDTTPVSTEVMRQDGDDLQSLGKFRLRGGIDIDCKLVGRRIEAAAKELDELRAAAPAMREALEYIERHGKCGCNIKARAALADGEKG